MNALRELMLVLGMILMLGSLIAIGSFAQQGAPSGMNQLIWAFAMGVVLSLASVFIPKAGKN